ncbi:MAG: hypothetical protein JOZ16_15945 [Methylobacteriaceae bacterium]|nr:hypothetical protein [Methylobacteriaceae bacterium]
MNLHLILVVLSCLSTYARDFPTLAFSAVVVLATACGLAALYGFEWMHRRLRARGAIFSARAHSSRR